MKMRYEKSITNLFKNNKVEKIISQEFTNKKKTLEIQPFLAPIQVDQTKITKASFY